MADAPPTDAPPATGDAPETTPPATDDTPLGEAGVKALAAWKDRARTAEAAAKLVPELQARVAELEAAQMTDHEKALQAARDEAAAATRSEVLGDVHAKLFNAELRAATAGVLLDSATQDLLVDPTIALRLLDLDEYPVTDNGDIDGAAIAQHVAAYVAARPHLAASATQRPGPIDQGAHVTTPKPLTARIADAEAAGDWRLASSLKLQQLAAVARPT